MPAVEVRGEKMERVVSAANQLKLFHLVSNADIARRRAQSLYVPANDAKKLSKLVEDIYE